MEKKTDPGLFLLAATLTAVLPLTKNEGVILMILNILLMLVPEKIVPLRPEMLKDFVKGIFIFLAVIVVVMGPWQLMVRYLANDNDINSLRSLSVANAFSGARKVPQVAWFTEKAFGGFQPNMFGATYAWGLLSVCVPCDNGDLAILQVKDGMLLSAVVLMNVLIVTAMYTLIPITSYNTMTGFLVSNLFRIYMPISPIVALQIVSVLKALESR